MRAGLQKGCGRLVDPHCSGSQPCPEDAGGDLLASGFRLNQCDQSSKAGMAFKFLLVLLSELLHRGDLPVFTLPTPGGPLITSCIPGKV